MDTLTAIQGTPTTEQELLDTQKKNREQFGSSPLKSAVESRRSSDTHWLKVPEDFKKDEVWIMSEKGEGDRSVTFTGAQLDKYDIPNRVEDTARYLIHTKSIAEGGEGVVYQAFDLQTRDIVAIKTMKEDSLNNISYRERFRHEALVHAKHEAGNHHIIPVFDYKEQSFLGPALFLKFTGERDHKSLRETIKKKQELPLPKIAQVLSDISFAADYLWKQGVLHFDIKPGNILVNKDTGRGLLIDFGWTMKPDDPSLEDFLGSPGYISPERVLMSRDSKITITSEVFSLGVIAYEMLVKGRLFVADRSLDVALLAVTMDIKKKVQETLPRELKGRKLTDSQIEAVTTVLIKALEKRPENRYQTATEFAKAFCEAISSKMIFSPKSGDFIIEAPEAIPVG
jgi:eukaryotic-like serine/threonine-protein kinase